jgi:hypothetical protein
LSVADKIDIVHRILI